MLERIPGIHQFQRRSPEIETGVGTAGLVAMAAASIDPEKMRHATDISPVGYSAIFDAASRVGAPDEVTFVALTLFFAFATAQGIYRMRHRNRVSTS